MGIGKKIVKQTALVVLPMTLLAFFLTPKAQNLAYLKRFGNPDQIPVSILIGSLLGLVNLNGLIWSLERLLGTHRANARLVFVSLFRLFLLFAVIILIVALKLVNLLGLVAGMTVVFVVLIKEGLKAAKEQSGT